MKYIGVLRDTARAPKPTTQYNTIQYHAIPFIRYKNCWFTHLCRKNKNSADLHTFVVKMSRVEFTRFFKTIIFILLVFLLVFYSYFCLKSARILLVFSKKWARMKNLSHWKGANRLGDFEDSNFHIVATLCDPRCNFLAGLPSGFQWCLNFLIGLRHS